MRFGCLCVTLFFILFITSSLYAQITNPVIISRTHTSFTKQGEVRAINGKFFKLMLNITIPQQTPYQNVSYYLPNKSTLYDDDGNNVAYIEVYNKSSLYKYAVRADINSQSRHLTSFNETYYIPSNLLQYTKQSKHIIITPAIKSRAVQITSNYQNDLDKIAALTIWTHNYITYDIDELGKNKDSDSVYSNPVGVCVEYTNLFIALSRSLGYPTRSVLGYAYSVEYGWQLHSWAEVYIGEWVGADPTWNEVGYIDATHIPIYFGMDTELADYANAYLLSDEANIQWIGQESLGTGTHDIKLLDYETSVLKYDINSYPSELPIGGSGAVLLSVQSPDYRTYSVQVVPCSADYQLLVFDEYSKDVFLHPGLNNIILPYTVSSNLDRNYIYTCPVTVAHDSSVDIVDIRITSEKTPGSKFTLTVPRYYGNEYVMRVEAKYPDSIYIASPHGMDTVSLGKGDIYEFNITSDPFLSNIMVYGSESSQVVRTSYSPSSFPSSFSYAVDELDFDADVPSDENSSLHLVLNLTGEPGIYTAKIYIDDVLQYVEKSDSSYYVLDAVLPRLPAGKHKVILIVDFGFEEYKQELQLNVFDPEINIHTINIDGSNRTYVFDVSGPYSYYDFYIDGIRVDPHKQMKLAEGLHTIQVEWVDKGGYARLHEEELFVSEHNITRQTDVCPSLFVLAAIVLILFYAKFNP